MTAIFPCNLPTVGSLSVSIYHGVWLTAPIRSMGSAVRLPLRPAVVITPSRTYVLIPVSNNAPSVALIGNGDIDDAGVHHSHEDSGKHHGKPDAVAVSGDHPGAI